MGRFMEWTSTEIEQMKQAFLQGEQIKIIAKKLGRTPTALNKALSRFGVRPPRKKNLPSSIPTVDWKRYLLPQDVKEDSLIVLPSPSLDNVSSSNKNSEPDFFKTRRYLKEKNSAWVPFSKITNHLEKQGYRVTCLDAKQGQFELDKKTVEKSYLLLLANRLRVEEAKPIFLVDEITW